MKNTTKILLAITILILSLMGCAGKANFESQLAGTWYLEGSQEVAFVLYDDGTCEIAGEYGTGTWNVVNDNQFKLTNYYGESETATIEKIENGELVLSAGDEQSVFSKNLNNESENKEIITEGSIRNSQNDLMTYLGMEMETANEQLTITGFYSHINSSVFEGSDYRSIDVYESGGGERLGIMQSQQGQYVDQVTVYYSDVSEQPFSIMGIHTGMTADEALDILRENNYTFRSIYDSTNEEKGDYQTVYYDRNGVYRISFDIYGGGETNPYGSLDESDIHVDGTVGRIDCQCVITDRFTELVNKVGDWSGHGGTIIAESINDECAELTMFIENDSFNVSGVDTYGTYVFGDNVITVDLQPGAGDWEYVTRVSISDVCPYMLCGIYYGMDRESALAHMSELGITARSEEDDSVVYDIDSYTTLEVHFADNRVCFIECIDDYPEPHEKRYIE